MFLPVAMAAVGEEGGGVGVCGQLVMSAQRSRSQPGSSDDIPLVGRLALSRPVFPATPVLMPAFVSPLKDAVSAATDEERLIKIHDVIQQLPPPHYRLGPSHNHPSSLDTEGCQI